MPLLAHIHVLEVLAQAFFTLKFINKDRIEVLLFLSPFLYSLKHELWANQKRSRWQDYECYSAETSFISVLEFKHTSWNFMKTDI